MFATASVSDHDTPRSKQVGDAPTEHEQIETTTRNRTQQRTK